MSEKLIAYRENDGYVFRASGLGNSVRAMVLALRGYEPSPPPPALQRAFDAGHTGEEALLEHVEKEFGGTVIERQQEYNWHIGSAVVIRGHLDGVFVGEEHGVGPASVEAKALGNDLYAKAHEGVEALFDRMPAYGYQAEAILRGVGDPLIYVAGHKDGEGGFSDYHIDVLAEVNAGWASEIALKTSTVIAHYERGTLPDACDCDGWCPYQYLHPAAKETEGDVGAELASLASQYAGYRQDRDAAADMLDAIKAKMIAVLEDANLDKAITPYHTVAYVEQKRVTRDWRAMQEAGIDLAPYEETAVSRTLRVTPRKDT